MSTIELITGELEECKRKAEEYLNGWKRAKADYINFEKQVEREKAEWFMFANASCVLELMPVIDSLEKARDSVPGIKNIALQMNEIFKKMGVESIQSEGEPVNPELHEVVAKEKSETTASGLIVKEVQRGYRMHGRVLRVAKVIVSE